jgi:hypothetical protein
MKRKILLLSTLLMVFFAGIIMAQSPIAYWPLDNNANDVIGGKNGTIAGGVQFLNDPDRGDVAYFDGVDGIINLPPVIWESETDTNTTICCWFNWDGGADWQRVYSLGKTDGAWKNMYFCPRDGWDDHSLHVTFHVLTPVDTWYDFVKANFLEGFDTITPGIWYHSALVLEENTVKLYMDGVKILDEDSVYVTPQKIQYKDSSDNVLGKSHWDDPTYMGMIDDFVIFGEALSEERIIDLYNGGSVISGIKEIKTNMTLNFYGSEGRILYTTIIDESMISNVSVYSLLGEVLFRSNRITDLKTRQFNTGIYVVSAMVGDKRIVNKVALFK